MEDGLHFVVGLVAESHDLLFPLDHKPQRHGLHAARRKLRLDLSPEYRGKLEAHKPVKDSARLLCVDKVHVDGARITHRVHDRILCDLVENDSSGLLLLKSESLEEVP